MAPAPAAPQTPPGIALAPGVGQKLKLFSMKIVGTDGLDPQTIRDEVARGARFVLYTYCVSLLIITLKRPLAIHYIRPGRSRITPGLLANLISLVLGWWGFPWGPIYTIQSLANNLSGGLDVTDRILATLPAAAAGSPPPPRPATPQPVATTDLGRKVLVGTGVVAALAFLIVSGVILYRRAHLTVVLVSGALQPYTVEVNGTPQTLIPGHPVVLTLSEGDITVKGGPRQGATPVETYHFALPFLDHLGESRVAIINPDRTALVFVEGTFYFRDGATPPAGLQAPFALCANEASYFLPEPDYVFTEFPKEIEMPKDTTQVSKTRVDVLKVGTIGQRVQSLSKQNGYAPALRHLELLADLQPNNEEILTATANLLKPEDVRPFFARHLGDRPVPVEWHRYYQQLMAERFPEIDLLPQYRAWAAAEPGDGALLYLLARITGDPDQTRALNQQALAAAKPCAYAYVGLGFDALCAGDFSRALGLLQSAADRHLKSGVLQHDLRAARLGLGDFAGLLRDATAAREKTPDDLLAVAEEISLGLAAGSFDRIRAEQLRSAFLTLVDRAKDIPPPQRAEMAAYLAATIDLGLGDQTAFAADIGKIDGALYRFQAAVSRGDQAAAAAVLKETPALPAVDHLLCYLVARTHDAPAAEAEFSAALAALDRKDRGLRPLVAHLRTLEPPTLEELATAPVFPEDKRVLYAALALRYPAIRAAFLAEAEHFNQDPAFPHLLIRQLTASAKP